MFSVIIPVYNAEKTIQRCVESLFSQTKFDAITEILLINDGSSDGSLELIKDFETKVDKIRVIDKKNEGVSKTRNLGIKEAVGEYLLFVDNDDYLDYDYIENFYNVVLKYNSDIVLGGYKRTNSLGNTLYEVNLDNTEWSKYIIVAPWARVYNKDFLVKNNILFFDYGIGEDVIFNLKAYSKTNNIAVIKYAGYNWYYNDVSVSNTTQKGLNKSLDITKVISEMLEVASLSNNKNNELINYYICRYYIWYLLFSGKYSNRETFVKVHDNIKMFLLNNRFSLKLSPFSSKLKGEPFSKRLIVFLFRCIEKLNMVNLFSLFYCKGNK